ncbi:MAG: sigma-54-dependent Fis family transcriptional regulator [Nitrospirae bacterium]|nr:sigma-54-dependent Fis family transcriptional regulator [Nitrospirota bacterium]
MLSIKYMEAMNQTLENIQSYQRSIPHTQGTIYKGKVLIVDDDIDVANAMQEYLTACGYMAVACTSGKEAIEKLRACDFELMLTDLMMPEMNGVELLKCAKEIDPYLMGIILTGKGTLETTTEMMKEVSFLCSLKPFNFKMMQLIISCAIKARLLKKLKKKYHLLTDELIENTWEHQNYNEETAAKELEIVELKREIDELKEELRCYEYLEKHWKQMI